ncbi:hypothetical protein [Streptomyces sp. DSM 40750]|uniref:hypothetical protein n=1 Tax=Streptomyces sp. DSM 40750 TaxID=2801030 RepID=UPI00214C13C1|nr:hypothetical protein [Streptomyces sp. DSM 40750]UUU23683.1 hypothetical protein JIX55_27385 [Streptomyces sp. DSM 40750]
MKPMLPSQTSTTEVPDEGGFAPLLAAWDVAHPTVADADWRHLLDEMAHPGTTQAFHRLAEAAA